MHTNGCPIMSPCCILRFTETTKISILQCAMAAQRWASGQHILTLQEAKKPQMIGSASLQWLAFSRNQTRARHMFQNVLLTPR